VTGISPEHLPHLFEPFYRASRIRESSGGHLGLGLYLVQSHVSAIGGNCYVQSAVGDGAAFEILLPVSKKAEKSVEQVVMG
jgi:signal transduction histidine kinase